MMKGPTKYLLSLVVVLGCILTSKAQQNYDDYINSSPDKKEFSDTQWKKLKGKMKSESSGNPANGEDFNSSDYGPSEGSEGDYYDYEAEDYKGEYSEYQNFEDYENQDYEYDEYDDYESYSNDNILPNNYSIHIHIYGNSCLVST